MLEFGSSIFYTNFSIFVIALSILNPVGHLLIIIAVHWKSCSGWSLKASIKLMRAALVPSIGALVNFQSITKTKQDFFELANKQLNVTLESIKFHIFLVDQLKGGRANVGTSTTIESGNSSQTIGYTVQTLRTLPEIILGKLQVLTDFPASYTSFQFLLLATTAIQSQHRVDFPEPLGPMSQIILLSLFYNFVFKLDQQGMTLLRFPEVVISKFQELINYFNKKKFILYYKFILLNQENKMDILILIKIIIIFFVNIFSYLIIKHFPANIDLPFYLFHKKMDHYRLFRVNRVRRADDAPGNEEHYKHPTYKQILEEMRNQNFDLQNKSNIDQLCEDCQNDCYDQIHSQYLLYLFSRLFPEDSACLYQNKKYKIRPCSINYSFRRCQSGTYHLWINGKRVLMCKEAYRIVQSIHGHQHRLPIIIKTRIQTDYNVYYDTIADFVEQFPYQCQYCAANLPKMKLNSPIWKQLYKKASNQQFLSLQQQIICSKKYNLYDCQTRLCKTDQYENKFEQARYCFLYKNFPPQKQTESDSSYQRRVQKLLKLVKKLDVRQCSQGTYHLWIYQANKRVPMKKQKQLIAQYLHGEQHLNYEEMVNKLREIREIYAQDLETSIKNIIRNCQKCHMFPKLKLKVQSRSADNLPKQQQPLSYLFDRIEPFNPEKQTEFVFLKRVKQLIQNFPFPSNISQYYDELKSSFKIPDRIMQVIQKQEFWVKKSSQQIIKFLQAHDIHIKTLTQQHQNQVTQYKGFIIYTDQMKCNYQLYGDTINFDFIDQVVKMRTFTGQYYLAILMTGLDQNFSNVLFGVCLIEGSEVINHRQVYELFFQQMGGYMPFNIVTGNNIYAQSAIKSLIKSKNLDIEYYINWFWVIDKLKIWTSKQQDKKRLMETMTSLLIETKAQGYKEKISQIKSIIGNRKTLNDFDLNRDKYCLCMAKKPKLMVYSMSTTKTKEFLDLFQRSVVKDRGLGQFVLHILELQKKLQLERIEKKKQNREKQGQIVKEQLGKDIQEKLCLILNKYGRIISSEMRQLYIKSLKQVKQLIPFHSYEVQINLISNSSHKIEKSDRQSNEEKNNMYGYHVISSPAQNTLNQCKVINSVRYLVEDDHWECSCRFQYAAGLPCHHLLPILSTFSASIQYYICQKWLNLHHDSNQYQLFPIQENHQLHKCKQQVKRASRQLVIDFSDLLKPKYQQNLFNFKHQYFNQATLFQKVYNRVKNNLALRSEMKKQRQNIHQNGENYDISNQIADQMSYSYESHNQNWMSHT